MDPGRGPGTDFELSLSQLALLRVELLQSRGRLLPAGRPPKQEGPETSSELEEDERIRLARLAKDWPIGAASSSFPPLGLGKSWKVPRGL